MIELSDILQEIGQMSLSAFWFPLLIWSACALLIHLVLKWMQNRDVLYHYHLRVALVAGIPLGICASGLVGVAADFFSSARPTTLITLQNPITVTPAQETVTASVNWGDPYLWIGMVTSVILAVGLFQLGRMLWGYYQISNYAAKLTTMNLREMKLAQGEQENFLKDIKSDIHLAFSEQSEVPFTFGWNRPVIVIPAFLQKDPHKLRMAVRHELMHIKRGDFLVNGFVIAMKSLLWFHPLIHYFENEIREYREISCDSEVLTDRTISRKQYAQLLFELAPRKETYAGGIVSMSVNKSTLQKRIKTMKTLANNNRPVTRSLIVSLVLLTAISGVIACSDLQEGGITNTELNQAQADMQNLEEGSQPLYIIREDTDLDGTFDTEEQISGEEGQKISRIKSEYIKNIHVYKGEQAVQKFGPKGSNGVVVIGLLDKKKAFSDLKSPGEAQQQQKPENEFFVVVEQMPELKGGLQALQQCIQYPEQARKAGIEGRVIVQFIVDEQGRVDNPTVVRGIGGGADEESLRCVKQMEFEPGKQRGNPVRVQYSLPVTFKLPGSISEESSSAYVEQPKAEGQMMALQNFTETENGITGKLVDKETGEPIAGVNIVVKGTSTGTSTNRNGEFSLEGIPEGGQEITISHVRYDMLTMKLNKE
ncbi:TonB family protein [Aliifodinibius sp. S!AR15-10]|uniref:TonB family protein n=1 Tax=Aliifodinibius sp. S!AR15-10 TaxID=2950437 RepID=UPI00285F631C|nr:TonB family protein [Aliifodinibius sp. S!AR15-10]MDR8393131.1 TonB family protein [Aliifodinibius sp. S!AR15-10]